MRVLENAPKLLLDSEVKHIDEGAEKQAESAGDRDGRALPRTDIQAEQNGLDLERRVLEQQQGLVGEAERE